jgi:ABC-type metal ion transport system substrate-binding protein
MASNENNVLIEPVSLYSQDIHTLDSLPKATIYFINGSKDNVKEIVGFKPIYKPKSELISELQLLNEIYLKEKLKKAEIKLKLVEYINSVYGKCDLNKLDLLLNEVLK